MPFFPFNTNVPATNDDPGDDQPIMKTNNNSLNGLLAVDHYSFNNGNGGFHQQVTLISQGSAVVPAAGTSGVFFSKTANANAWPHWKNSSGSAIPLIVGNPSAATPGFTYLPGAVLLQWGSVATPGATGVVNFTPNFVGNPFYVLLQYQTASPVTSSSRIYAVVTAVTSANFNFALQSNVTIDLLYWMAIGLSTT
jgi:hypothetical protein